MYQFTPNRKKNTQSPHVIIGVIVIGIIVFGIIMMRTTLFRVTNTVRMSAGEIRSMIVDRSTPKSVLIERQRLLQEQVATLEQQLLGVQLLEDENNSLRTILNYPVLPQTSIPARVISKPSQSLYDRIIIDRGTNDGITVGDSIIAGENALIARIDTVTATTAEGLLLSGSFFKGDAVITRLGVTVPVEGKGSGNFELHIPRDLDVRDGDIMTLPGVPEFIFGIIKSVQFDDRDPYQTVLARTPVNVQELKFVRVIK